MSLLRRKRATQPQALPPAIDGGEGSPSSASGEEKGDKEKKARGKKEAKKRWSCLDSCCWLIGCICTAWWLLLFLYKMMPPSFPQLVTEAITGPMPDPPGVKLRKEGLRARHPVVFVPGIVTGGLELWEGHHCADGLFRKRLWGGTFGEVYKRRTPPWHVIAEIHSINMISLKRCVAIISQLEILYVLLGVLGPHLGRDVDPFLEMHEINIEKNNLEGSQVPETQEHMFGSGVGSISVYSQPTSCGLNSGNELRAMI